MRLGHAHEGGVVYSEGWEGPHQPFQHGDDLYNTDDAPHGKIYKNAEVWLAPWQNYVEVGNPWVDGEWLYYEARRKNRSPPAGWEIWRCHLTTRDREFVIDGANPCVFDKKLYYGVWKNARFEIAVTD